MPQSDIKITVNTTYLGKEKDSSGDTRYGFSYHVKIQNEGSVTAQLLRRRWLITDSNARTIEVEGDGVIGETPHIKPGEFFEYESGAILDTPTGMMEGSYEMVDASGTPFDAPVNPFVLAKPNSLH